MPKFNYSVNASKIEMHLTVMEMEFNAMVTVLFPKIAGWDILVLPIDVTLHTNQCFVNVNRIAVSVSSATKVYFSQDSVNLFV